MNSEGITIPSLSSALKIFIVISKTLVKNRHHVNPPHDHLVADAESMHWPECGKKDFAVLGRECWSDAF